MVDPTTARGPDPVAQAHSSGTMGSHPSQAVFIGTMAMVLVAFMALCVIAAFVAMGR